METTTFKPPQEVFDAAIASSRLSVERSAPNYAGHYMYMGTTDKRGDMFKHQDTREYLPSAR